MGCCFLEALTQENKIYCLTLVRQAPEFRHDESEPVAVECPAADALRDASQGAQQGRRDGHLMSTSSTPTSYRERSTSH